MQNKWTKEEVAKLRKLYPILRVKQLIPYFPGRNKQTIAVKALSLNLRSAKLWQPEENTTLRQKFVHASRNELLTLLPKRTWLAVMAQAERLGIKRHRNKPRLPVNEEYFTKWGPNMAYLLGYILADGCIMKGVYKGYSDALKFGVQLKDKDILEKIKKELSAEHSISIVRNAAHLSVTSQKLVDSLKRLGITYRKSLKETPADVPPKYLTDYIRGIIDGDGGISFDKRQYPTLRLCGSLATVSFVRKYFWDKFRAFSKITKRISNFPDYCLCDISYRSNTAKKIILHLYNGAGMYLNRKYQLAMRCHNITIRVRNNKSIYNKYAIDSGGKSHKI
jgi:hypothetical protein